MTSVTGLAIVPVLNAGVDAIPLRMVGKLEDVNAGDWTDVAKKRVVRFRLPLLLPEVFAPVTSVS
jgi:hypothetical protein